MTNDTKTATAPPPSPSLGHRGLITRSSTPRRPRVQGVHDPELVAALVGLRDLGLAGVRDRPAGRRHVALRDRGRRHGGGFHGEYKELDAPRRLVSTEVDKGIPGADENDALDIVTSTRSTAYHHVTPGPVPRTRRRDGLLASGMESGMQTGYDRMEDLLREMQ